MNKLILLVSLLINFWFAYTIIKLDNFSESTIVGMCNIDDYQNPQKRIEWIECNKKQTTKTNKIFNLISGLQF